MDRKREDDRPPVVDLDTYRQRHADPWDTHAAEYRLREAERAAQRDRNAAEVAAQRARVTVATGNPWHWLTRRRGGPTWSAGG